MGLAVSCPRCGGDLRPPGLAHSDWVCERDGPVPPLHTAQHVNQDVFACASKRAAESGVPLWCPWPLPTGWTVTGVAWAGDDRSGVSATALACSGPTPFSDGPADVLLIAEEPGVGLGAHFAGLTGTDPGPALLELEGGHGAHAKVKAGGHPTPLWAVSTPDDRCAYAGEAQGRWLYAVTWPAQAGYLLSEEVVLQDLSDWLPPELVFGALSPRLRPTR
ncbi:DUF6758 family protein [Catellatospora vulcania]|uniref:DUF6758 family protein n=1 Tax=Catellatospora vulcania TaxID=1460450 RepID=UPI0012D4A3B2|nr:DUF6758 family protein [Catellatospora vulcania]